VRTAAPLGTSEDSLLRLYLETVIFGHMVDMTVSVALFLALSGLLLARPLLRLAR
jgi:hypothetical protein